MGVDINETLLERAYLYDHKSKKTKRSEVFNMCDSVITYGPPRMDLSKAKEGSRETFNYSRLFTGGWSIPGYGCQVRWEYVYDHTRLYSTGAVEHVLQFYFDIRIEYTGAGGVFRVILVKAPNGVSTHGFCIPSLGMVSNPKDTCNHVILFDKSINIPSNGVFSCTIPCDVCLVYGGVSSDDFQIYIISEKSFYSTGLVGYYYRNEGT